MACSITCENARKILHFFVFYIALLLDLGNTPWKIEKKKRKIAREKTLSSDSSSFSPPFPTAPPTVVPSDESERKLIRCLLGIYPLEFSLIPRTYIVTLLLFHELNQHRRLAKGRMRFCTITLSRELQHFRSALQIPLKYIWRNKSI